MLLYFYFRSCGVGEVFHQVFGEELVQEGLLNSLMPFLIPNKKQLQSSVALSISSNSLNNSGGAQGLGNLFFV